jgi:hypothetical protein
VRWGVIIAVLAIAFVLVAGEIFLPWIVAKGLEMGLERTLGQGATYEASLKARPALRLLAGRVDTVTVESQKVKAATLAIDSIAVTVDDIALNLGALLTKRSFSVSYNPSIGTVIRISESSLRKYVLDNVAGLDDPAVQIHPDGVRIAGYVTLARRPFLVALVGTFVADGEQHVRFAVTELSLDSEALSPGLTASLMEALGGPALFIDLARFPVPLVLKSVALEDGWLVIKAGARVR